MKSSSSVGPRGVARSEFWLSPTGMPWLVVSCGCLPRAFWCNSSPVPRASGALAERSTETADAGLPEDLAMGTPRWRAEMLAIPSSLGAWPLTGCVSMRSACSHVSAHDRQSVCKHTSCNADAVAKRVRCGSFASGWSNGRTGLAQVQRLLALGCWERTVHLGEIPRVQLQAACGCVGAHMRGRSRFCDGDHFAAANGPGQCYRGARRWCAAPDDRAGRDCPAVNTPSP